MMHEALQLIHNNQMNKKQALRKNSVSGTASPKNSELNMKNLHSMTRSAPQLKTSVFSSSITVHKLRESKWFKNNEINILLSVVESGFILEKRNFFNNNHDHDHEHEHEHEHEQQDTHTWGIAMWESGQEKSKNINHLYIYTLWGTKEKMKVINIKLAKFWPLDHEIRINNLHDKDKMPNSEDDIRKQIEYALKNKSHKWHNNQHFPYFCRYEKPMHGRIQQISERVRWNSIGVSLGMLMRGRNRRPTASR